MAKKSATTSTETISRTINGSGGQKIDYDEVLAVEVPGFVRKRKLRIAIHVDDSYPFQSDIRVDVWDERNSRWSEVHRLPGRLTTVPSGLPYRKTPPTFADFSGDRAELIRVAIEVLS